MVLHFPRKAIAIPTHLILAIQWRALRIGRLKRTPKSVATALARSIFYGQEWMPCRYLMLRWFRLHVKAALGAAALHVQLSVPMVNLVEPTMSYLYAYFVTFFLCFAHLSRAHHAFLLGFRIEQKVGVYNNTLQQKIVSALTIICTKIALG
jgi:hypothetical protein